MHLYFIRHAQSENNLRYAQTGSFEGRDEDPGLAPLGWQQAEYLAHFLSQPSQLPAGQVPAWDAQDVGGFGITHLYCSLMIRSIATGTVVARALNLPLVAWVDLHEVGGIHRKDLQTGDSIGLPGRNRAFFEVHYPDLVLPDSLGDEGWWNRRFEDRELRPLRARRFVDELLQRHGGTDHRVAVISHGGFHNHVLRAILGLPEATDLWFSLNNTAITRIEFGPEGTSIQYVNRAGFLPLELIT